MENYGTGVSYVDQITGYSYDTIVFQKGKPPLDTEMNALQQVRNILDQREHSTLPSGWLTLRPFYVNSQLSNSFYTQDPATAIPEYALVNGSVLYVTNTATTTANANLINLESPPATGNQVNGIFLEVWRALLSPTSSMNRPVPETVIDALKDISVINKNTAWTVGENGLVLYTPDGGQTWTVQLIDTKNTLNGVFFVTGSIGWVVGTNGCIARTTSGGQRWNVLTTGFNQDLNSIYATSQLIAWAVGNSGVILKTSNAVTWLAETSGVSVDLNSVYFSNLNPLVGWIVGKSGTILRTNDGGANWTRIVSGTTVDLNSVYFYNLSEGFAVGNSGTILKSTNGGLTWVGLTSGVSVNLTDVAMTPSLDQEVVGEEVTSQFTGSNKNFTTMNAPITVGDGQGTITNLPGDITVTVNNAPVAVDILVGATGQVVLALPPRAGNMVKVTYNYRITNNIFRGNAYVTGQTGTVLQSTDVGATWLPQISGVSYDLNAVAFADLYDGWLVGISSIIRHTIDSGAHWLAQSSNIPYRQIQRAFFEGNTLSNVYLPDDSIHPDVNIETTERVQIQYSIRIVSNVDPLNFPEAGLGSQVVLAKGPNSTGTFSYENMGPINGDYGLWRAKCANTIDGYSYAIPMFFVNRRNSKDYDPLSNANGSTNYTINAIRLDLLTANRVIDSDILDVRRQIQVPAVGELLDSSFEQLMDGRLKAKMALDIAGGDKFGTEIFQLDRVNSAGGDTGGTLIAGASLNDAVSGHISSRVFLNPVTYPILVPSSRPVPTPQTFTDISGVFHPNSLYYSALYEDTNLPVPGYFEGFGTSQLKFTFDSSANTQAEDPGLAGLNYLINATQINTSPLALSHVPSQSALVKNVSGTGAGPDFYYQGVFDSETSGRVIEQWPSGMTGYNNYALVYPGSDTATAQTETRASTVEMHYFIKTDASNVSTTTTTSDTLTIKSIIAPLDSSSSYNILTISKLNNVTAGFSYKIKNLVLNSNNLRIQTAPGFPFVLGTVFEVVGQCLSSANYATRCGASVNFAQGERKIGTFCSSVITSMTSVASTPNPITISLSNSDTIIGTSSTDSTGAINTLLPFCWVGTGISPYVGIHPIQILSDFTSNFITFNISDMPLGVGVGVKITLQALTKQKALTYSLNTDSLLIGYNYIPYQSISDPPSNLSVQIVLKPTTMNVSNLGTGGSIFDREPYQQPLINIPVNDPLILDDNSFYNVEPLRFANFSVDGGFAQLPAYVPGNMGGTLNLSNPKSDNLGRFFYGTNSKEFNFRTEGLLTPASRKVFAGLLGRVLTSSDNRLLRGEYVLMIVSQNELLSLENTAGFIVNNKSVIAIYRLPNRPIVRI